MVDVLCLSDEDTGRNKKDKRTEAEIALERSEKSRKRKNLSDKKLEEEVSPPPTPGSSSKRSLKRPPMPVAGTNRTTSHPRAENRNDQPTAEKTGGETAIQQVHTWQRSHGRQQHPYGSLYLDVRYPTSAAHDVQVRLER